MLLLGTPLQAQQSTHIYCQRDTALRCDVWTPAIQRPDSACVIAVFGGGFVNGHRANDLQCTIAKQLTDRGFVVINIDYRLGLRDSTMTHQYATPTKVRTLFQWAIDIATEDVCAACRWVVDHASQLHINPQHVVLTGSSAGAIAVLQADWCRANSLPQAAALPAGWQPMAVVPYSGAIMSHGKLTYNTSPSPTLLMHGEKDKIVSYSRFPKLLSHALRGSKTIYTTMHKAGYPVWFIHYPGIGHEVAGFLPATADLFTAFVDQVAHGRITTLDATMTDTQLKPTKWTSMTFLDLYK